MTQLNLSNKIQEIGTNCFVRQSIANKSTFVIVEQVFRVTHSCTVQCTALYFTVQYSTVLYCSVFYRTVVYYTNLYCTVLYCTEMYFKYLEGKGQCGVGPQRTVKFP